MLKDELKIYQDTLVSKIEDAVHEFEQDTGFVIEHVKIGEPGSIKAHNMKKCFPTGRIEVKIKV